MANNSILNNNNKPVALQNTKIKKITECTGFFDIITPIPVAKAKLAQKLNNKVCIVINFII